MSCSRRGRLALLGLALFFSLGLQPLRALSPRSVGIIRSKLDAAVGSCTDGGAMREAVGDFIAELVRSGLTADDAGRQAFLDARRKLETRSKELKKPGGMSSFFVLKVRLLGDSIVEAAAKEGGIQALEGLPGALGLPPRSAETETAASGTAAADGSTEGYQAFEADRARAVGREGEAPPPPPGYDPEGDAATGDTDSSEESSTEDASTDGYPSDDGAVDAPSSDDGAATADGSPAQAAAPAEGSSPFEIAYEEDPVRRAYEALRASTVDLTGSGTLVVVSPVPSPCRFDLLDAATDSPLRRGLETDRPQTLQAGIYHVILLLEGSRVPRYNVLVAPGAKERISWPALGTLQLASPATGSEGVRATVRDAFSNRVVREAIGPEQSIRLPEGSWKLEFTDGSGRFRQGRLPIRSGKVATIRP